MEDEEEYKSFLCQFKLKNNETMIQFPGESFQSLSNIPIKEELLEDENYKNMLHPSVQPPVITKVEEGENKLDQPLNEVEMEDQQGSQPDMYDANNHCTPCERTFNTRKLYLYHLRTFHKIYFRTPKPIPNLRVQPDVDDPNNYCKSCDHTFTCNRTYRRHVNTVHSTNGTLNEAVMEEPDVDDPDNYCKPCKKTYKSRTGYLFHLRSFHKIKLKAPKICVYPDLIPDENDPNNYCISCDYTFKGNTAFRRHLQTVHNIGNKLEKTYNFKKPDEHIIIDEYDTGKYCQSCRREFIKRPDYLGHLRNAHKVILILKGSRKSIELNRQIIRSKSSATGQYCNSCNQNFSVKEDYLRHLHSRSHKLTVIQKTLCNKINPNDGKFCSICDTTFSRKEHYRRHLETAAHKLNVENK